jgi:hypothetical protein
MKTGARNTAMLNYNSLTEEMIFEQKGRKLAVSAKELELIDTIFINDRKFVPLNSKFVELVHHQKWDLYVEFKCKAEPPGKPSGYGGTSKTSAISSYSSILSEGYAYELKLPDGYTLDPYVHYWLNKSGDINKFTNMRELKKMFEEKEDLFKTYQKEHRVKYEDQESIIQFIKYLESN